MQQTRIAPLSAPYDADAARPLAQLEAAGLPPLALFRTVARNPRVLERLLAGHLLDAGSIAPRERELVVLRTCARCGCAYEWGVHAATLSRQAGLTDAEIARLAGPAAEAGLPARETLLLEAVDALHDTARLPDALWQALRGHYSEAQCLEIVALAGYYHTISFLCNATGVTAESFAAAFPA